MYDSWGRIHLGVTLGGSKGEHGTGLFLDLLAVAGYRVEPIVVPELADVLPVAEGPLSVQPKPPTGPPA